MELSLRYNENATRTLNAAFVRGNGPGMWLQEMSTWQIPVEKLECYIISNNNDPHEAAGLFVIFSGEQRPGILQVKQPYTVMGGRLYLPIDADLSPAVTEQELQSLLIWHCQVFHPAIGFTGFEKTDRIVLSDLLEHTQPQHSNWDLAQPGNAPRIPLHQINLQKLSAEEIFDLVKDSINSKPLKDISKSNRKDVPGWLNNPVSEKLLKGTFSFLKVVGTIGGGFGLTGAGGGLVGKPGNGSRGDAKPGLFGSMLNWMQERIEDLEKQRDSELKRLTDMFEKNIDEFLQYAIPLNNPYLNRGTADPSAHLTKNPLQFNPGRLGGGYAVDGWNLDYYYDELRSKYLSAAQQAIANKDFKKAAYVYAHLLGDYTQAAAALKQGKHYREAAALYKDHLNNPQQAAACYEEGGLYTEAIALYTELKQYEKAGDLYRLLDQKEHALSFYEKSVESAAENKDYLEQSRIITDKIGDKPRAKQVLLNGWHDVKQPEACLTKYFDLLADDNKTQLHEAVRVFYSGQDLGRKRLPFLNVIDGVNRKYKTSELENTCRNIAYEVVSEEVSAGNNAGLHRLRNFISDDQLIEPDCYRFIHTSKNTAEQKPTGNDLQLMKEMAWKKVLKWHDQLLVWGTTPTKLALARINGDGYTEYFSWQAALEPPAIYIPLADAENTNKLIVYTNLYKYANVLSEKLLPGNKYFRDNLVVLEPEYINKPLLGIGVHDGDLITLHQQNGEEFLNTYSLTGELKTSVRCSFNESGLRMLDADANEMICCGDYFYLACENSVLRISNEGGIDVLYAIEGIIHKVVVYQQPGNPTITIGFSTGYSAIFIRAEGNDPLEDPFEVETFTLVTDVAILPGNRYVVADDAKKVQLFHYLEGNGSPKLYRQFTTENTVVALFQGNERDQLGVLESNGKISFHVIN